MFGRPPFAALHVPSWEDFTPRRVAAYRANLRQSACCLLVLGLTAQTPAPTATSVSDPIAIYRSAVGAMAALPPQTVSGYDETITPRGLGLKILQVNGMAVVHIAYTKDTTPRVFHVAVDGANTAVVDANSGQRYTAGELFWSPTWSTTPPPTPPSQMTVIATVRERALADLLTPADANYTLSFVGIENVNNVPVYHIRLVARQDATAHPLTDVYADQQTYLVRRAVAAFTDNSVTNVTGALTMNFDRVGNSWLLDSGQVDATVHALLQQVSGSATFAASGVTP